MAEPWDALARAREGRDSITARATFAVQAVEAGWPVKAVAMAVGVSTTTIYRWLRDSEADFQGVIGDA